ncbi:hypothetical protein [Natrinema sp. 1APR25-10V2]|uniref:hypothetical protein n=1 Tax=Natrinema sp. 1APR25-10V2 TaxID=2951081 RepID=UPI00287425E6|nr:hypothetical protein [Natrinema sp. 1APR25-10V2]MDS0477008.1 hypothetical protein [Natrinema sp. 1APR25-10V2]
MNQRELATLGALGVLAEEETATVRAVHETLQHNFGNYWGASTGVLGPTMTRLEEAGHVGLTLTDGGTYRITESGIARLQSLLRDPVDGLSSSPLQPQLVMKLGFLHHLPLPEQREEIDALADRVRTAREELGDVKSIHEAEVDDAVDTGYRGDLILLRIFVLDALLDWLDALEIDCVSER